MLTSPRTHRAAVSGVRRNVRGHAEEFHSEASAPQPARRGPKASAMHVYSQVVALLGKPGTKSEGSTGARAADEFCSISGMDVEELGAAVSST